MEDVKKYLEDAEEKMEFAAMHLEEALSRIRAGRANVHILDEIRVDSYGSKVPLSNVASLNTPDARSIAIKPWDKSMLKVIEKAIIDSSVGIMPENNGEIIRLGIPALTEERRKDLVKEVKKKGEECKVAVRNVRRDGNEAYKKLSKTEISEDEIKDLEDELQKATDKFVKDIDKAVEEKAQDILKV